MPTSSSKSIASMRAACFDRSRLARTASTIWLPTVSIGSNAASAFWNTIPISEPRTSRSVRVGAPTSSWPRHSTEPVTSPSSISPTSERTETDLPAPDSPTMPSVSPARRS
ncbi:hypothetical protein SY89_00925 [Halolamina pelagica]|uniref:Uncharacterized protein n=1 Tax=Halolamina pelagica TaxID=699431 RepID=A0A0P7GA09_9EURY|nr:hypothetical protein [Halolamina pelagica]KPN30199.1 hypothetical protein SY89_00925 [Halolamina pelagica]